MFWLGEPLGPKLRIARSQLARQQKLSGSANLIYRRWCNQQLQLMEYCYDGAVLVASCGQHPFLLSRGEAWTLIYQYGDDQIRVWFHQVREYQCHQTDETTHHPNHEDAATCIASGPSSLELYLHGCGHAEQRCPGSAKCDQLLLPLQLFPFWKVGMVKVRHCK